MKQGFKIGFGFWFGYSLAKTVDRRLVKVMLKNDTIAKINKAATK